MSCGLRPGDLVRYPDRAFMGTGHWFGLGLVLHVNGGVVKVMWSGPRSPARLMTHLWTGNREEMVRVS